VTTEQLERIGREAGESLAARAAGMPALAKRPLATERVRFLIPSRDLREMDETALMTAFVSASHLLTAPGAAAVSSYALTVEVTTLIRRGHDGGVVVDYAFSFAVTDRFGELPWAKVLETSVEGGRGELEPQALGGADLDKLAIDAALFAQKSLRDHSRPKARLEIVRATPDTQVGISVGFQDRFRAELLKLGVVLGGSDALAGIDITISNEGLNPVTAGETHRFKVAISAAGAPYPWDPWERIVEKSSGP
jgi:hypothetical protein